MMQTTETRIPFRTISVEAAARQGLAPYRVKVESLRKWLPADGSVAPLWDHIGNVHGEVLYGISHFRATDSRVEIVNEDGNVVVAYPYGQGRTIRILGAAR